MEHQDFEVLENKINKMLSMLNRLKAENEELVNKNRNLQSLLDEREKIIQTLKAEKNQYSKIQNEVDTYRESQDHIRAKVETLLDKLKEFEDIQ